MTRQSLRTTARCLALLIAASPGAAAAQTIRTDAGFTTNTLERNDDQSTGLVPVGFAFNFFGVTGNSVYVNNNGNITFDEALGTFTPFPLLNTGRQIIAPYFTDIDTRSPSPGVTQFGTSLIGGRAAFGVNWLNVGYFSARADKLASAQLVLIDRSDIGAGDFDFEFNYGSLQFEAGGASGDNNPNNGICEAQEPECVPARAGWSNGSANSFEVPGSGVRGALIDGGPNALNGTRLTFNVRGGQVQPPTGGPGGGTVVPEPSTYLLMGTGLLGLAGFARRRTRPTA